MAAAAVEAPPFGAYLTDGRRLLQVVGTEQKTLLLDDCVFPVSAPGPLERVRVRDALSRFRAVRPRS